LHGASNEILNAQLDGRIRQFGLSFTRGLTGDNPIYVVITTRIMLRVQYIILFGIRYSLHKAGGTIDRENGGLFPVKSCQKTG
jgi:hypothetical protein